MARKYYSEPGRCNSIWRNCRNCNLQEETPKGNHEVGEKNFAEKVIVVVVVVVIDITNPFDLSKV